MGSLRVEVAYNVCGQLGAIDVFLSVVMRSVTLGIGCSEAGVLTIRLEGGHIDRPAGLQVFCLCMVPAKRERPAIEYIMSAVG